MSACLVFPILGFRFLCSALIKNVYLQRQVVIMLVETKLIVFVHGDAHADALAM